MPVKRPTLELARLVAAGVPWILIVGLCQVSWSTLAACVEVHRKEVRRAR